MRSLQQPPSLPDGLAVSEAIAPLAAKVRHINAEARTIRAERDAATRNLPIAKKEDTAANATAYLANPDAKPSQKREEALKARIETLTRDFEIRVAAARSVDDEAERLLLANADAWANEVSAAAVAAAEERAAALAAVAAASRRLAELQGLHRWVTSRGDAKSAGILPVVFIHNNSFALDDVLGALLRLPMPPAPKAEPDPEPVAV